MTIWRRYEIRTHGGVNHTTLPTSHLKPLGQVSNYFSYFTDILLNVNNNSLKNCIMFCIFCILFRINIRENGGNELYALYIECIGRYLYESKTYYYLALHFSFPYFFLSFYYMLFSVIGTSSSQKTLHMNQVGLYKRRTQRKQSRNWRRMVFTFIK